MEEQHLDMNDMARRVSGKSIARLTTPKDGRLVIHFDDGSALVVERGPAGLAIDLQPRDTSSECPAALWPTRRQQDYLDFIQMYMDRFHFAPAEADIQRHFLVSAPSVNQMMQSLERHGFIRRQRGVARSIRMVEAADCSVCGQAHHLKSIASIDLKKRR
jgi:repressor LexA